MRIGVDTYSYHRLLGWPRPGERPGEPFPGGWSATLAHARELGCDVVSLQTCFLPPAAELDIGALRDAAGPLDVVPAWGHPEGLAFGARPGALADLLAWLDVASALGCALVRIVVGGPALRGAEPFAVQRDRTREPLRTAAAHAADRGIALAIENHGEIESGQLLELIEYADVEGVGVCFDTANAPRVGEDAAEAAARLAPLVRMVHLKDVEPPERASDPVAGPCTVPYGTGVVGIARTLDALAAPIAAGVPVCVEIGQVAPDADELALVEHGVRWLQTRAAAASD